MTTKKQNGGARAGAGRKPGVRIKPASQIRDKQISVFFTAAEKRKISSAARAARKTQSTYLRDIALASD